MIGLGPIQEIRHYLWMNNLRKEQVNFNTAYCIMPVDEQYSLPWTFYNQARLIAVIHVKRGGQPAHDFRVYRLTRWKGKMYKMP